MNPLRSISNAKLLLLHLFRTANAIILNMKKKTIFLWLDCFIVNDAAAVVRSFFFPFVSAAQAVVMKAKSIKNKFINFRSA